MHAALDPDENSSPLGRPRKEMDQLIKDRVATVMKERREDSLCIAARGARAEMIDRTTAKGFDFEELVDLGLAVIAAVHGDVAENVGRITGGAGTRNGDHLVTLNAEDTCGQHVAFVLESKDHALTMTKTLAALDEAMQRHPAQAAVAVFSRQELVPTKCRRCRPGQDSARPRLRPAGPGPAPDHQGR